MRRLLQSALILGLSSLAAAVFKDEVGHADFHHALVGVPQRDTTFFHRPRLEDKASLLYTLGDVGVVGAINPSNGAVVWRQQIAANATGAAAGGHLRASEGENWIASAHGSRVQAWNALTGRNVWQMEFEGEVKDLEIMDITENSRKDVLAMFDEDGVTVLRRLHGAVGTVIWEFRSTTKDVPLQVSTNHASLYVISLHGSPSSYTLKVISVDPATGRRADEWTIGTKGEVHQPEDVMFVGANSAAPFLAWTNAAVTKLSVNVLGTKSRQEFALPPDTVSVHIHAPQQVQSLPHFLVHIRSQSGGLGETGNRGEVYHIDLKTGNIKSAFELPFLPGLGAFSTSSEGANVYFTRVHDDEVLVTSSEDSITLASWRLKAGEFVEPMHAVSEVVKKAGGEGFAVRSALVTRSNDWMMIRNGGHDWTRPEGLSGAVAAVWAEVPEDELLAKVLEQEAHTNPLSAYVRRVTRHMADLIYLPGYLVSIPSALMSNIFSSDATSSHGTFGFNKIIVLATKRGCFYGLDTGDHGKVLWSTSFFNQAPGEAFDVRGMISDDEKGTVTVRGSKGELLVIRTTNGQLVEGQPAGILPPVASTAVIEDASGKWLLPFGADGKPSEGLQAGKGPASTLVVQGQDGILKGVKFIDSGDKAVEQEIWQLQVYPGQKIVDVATMPTHNPVASIGRVLGDRRVSYKYLNPNAMVVAVFEEATTKLSIQLVDSISGQVLAAQQYEGVDADKAISCAIAENWYACTFFGEYALGGSSQSIKGYQLMVSDLYESPEPNERGPLGSAANFSSLAPVDTPSGVPVPWVMSQAWVVSQQLEKLAVTQTGQGITNKELLAYMPETHGVLGMPRALLDPRRPVGRDPTAAEMEAEGLPRYAPGMEIDSKTVVSHEWDVLGVEGILATTAAVESTSLVVAYGVDVFGTRVAPSGVFDILGKGFDKAVLTATVLALFVGVVAVAPMVSFPFLPPFCPCQRVVSTAPSVDFGLLTCRVYVGAEKADQCGVGGSHVGSGGAFGNVLSR